MRGAGRRQEAGGTGWLCVGRRGWLVLRRQRQAEAVACELLINNAVMQRRGRLAFTKETEIILWMG